MTTDDPVFLDEEDFRRERRLLSPTVFFWSDGEPETWPVPDDIVSQDAWDHIMGLSTHVALESTGHAGSAIDRLNQLHSDWVFSWPDVGTAPYMEYPSLIAGEEFDALVFNTVHGFYRQAISSLRVALETLVMAAGFAVAGESASFEAWQRGRVEAKFGKARALLRDSDEGRAIDVGAAPADVRAKPEPEPTEDETEPDADGVANRQALRQITDLAPNLAFVNRTGKPILSLPEGETIQEEPDDPRNRQRPRCRDLTRCCQAASLEIGGRPPRAEWPRRVL